MTDPPRNDCTRGKERFEGSRAPGFHTAPGQYAGVKATDRCGERQWSNEGGALLWQHTHAIHTLYTWIYMYVHVCKHICM